MKWAEILKMRQAARLTSATKRHNHKESNIQQNAVTWFRLQYPQLSKVLIAVPNGGRRGKIEACIMKAEGVVAGAADMLLLTPRGNYGALCIEFKTETGRQSPKQKEWQEAAEKAGNKYVIVRSEEEFMAEIREYLERNQ